jgi:hypothetical protein
MRCREVKSSKGRRRGVSACCGIQGISSNVVLSKL